MNNHIYIKKGVSMNTLAINEPQLLVLAEEGKAKGRVTQWNSVDEMFDTVLGE